MTEYEQKLAVAEQERQKQTFLYGLVWRVVAGVCIIAVVFVLLWLFVMNVILHKAAGDQFHF